ncbi:MAG TPA: amidase [Thermodesulfobacteriota bacterium]
MPLARDPDVCFLSAGDLVRRFRARRLSPTEVVQAVLARIDALNPRLCAMVTVDREGALAAARRATAALGRGRALPPLHGVPVTVKDVIPTRGMRTTWGSRIYERHVPDEDALVVERLRAAGAIVIGKTNTPEFAAGANTFNAVFGATRNPWDLRLTCGGSSGGAAVALATGMGPLALGSDLGGSLRIPAAFCGVVGFRPTPGLVPVYPTVLAWDTLSVQGPMARTVDDAARLLAVIAGPDDRAPISYPVDPREFLRAVRSPSVRGWRVAFSADLNGLVPMDPEVASVAEGAIAVFRSLGARVERGAPDFDGLHEIVLATRGLSMVARHAEKLPRWRDEMQAGLVRNIEQGLSLDPSTIGRAERLRTALWHRVRAFMAERDLLLLPTTSLPPFPVEQPYPTEVAGRRLETYVQWIYPTYAVSVVGLPAISVPCGFTRGGLPVGLQIVGRRMQDAAVLRAAAAFERAAPWAGAVPPVVRGA